MLGDHEARAPPDRPRPVTERHPGEDLAGPRPDGVPVSPPRYGTVQTRLKSNAPRLNVLVEIVISPVWTSTDWLPCVTTEQVACVNPGWVALRCTRTPAGRRTLREVHHDHRV